MRISITHSLRLAAGALVAFAPFLAVAAQADEPGDPGVARLSVLSGEVDVRRADSGDTFAAALNAPVSVGDYLSTLDDSRAEVEFNYGAAVRVAPDTQVRFTRLDPQNHELQLAQGTVDLRVFRELAAHPQIDTPAAMVRPDAHGSYRVTVTDDGNTEVTVRSGQVDVAVAAGTQTIGPGSTLLVTGSGDAAQFQTIATVALDDFDAFNRDRDAFVARATDDRYVDAGMLGAEDLDQYGHWIDAPQYGHVWVPYNQASGWAPYSSGRWVWEPYYGWTWVGYEPWGWAPYHYGNWYYAAGPGWCWYPGAYAVATPYVYRPALVAFFSFGGGGGGLSFGFGNIGWVPVAPFEPFHPWWNGGGWGGTTIVQNTTIINNYNITNVYHNASAPGGAVAVGNRSFASGNFTHVQPVTPAQLQTVQPVRGVVPIVPTQRNLAFNPRRAAPLASAPLGPEKFAHFTPPAAAPRTFVAERTAIAATAQKQYPEGAPLFAKQAQTLKPLTPQVFTESAPVHTHPMIPANQPAGAPAAGGANPWTRFESTPSGPSKPIVTPKVEPAPKAEVAPRTELAPKVQVAPNGGAPEKSYVAPRPFGAQRSYAAPKQSAVRKQSSRPRLVRPLKTQKEDGHS